MDIKPARLSRAGSSQEPAMAVIASKLCKEPHLPAFSAVIGWVRRVVAKTAHVTRQAMDIIAEARLQRAMLEVELYRNRYRLSSKNDDDLPVVR